MISDYLPVFLTMFILIDPLGVAMVYLGLANGAGLDQGARRRVAFRSSLIAFVVLTLFIFLGQQLIDALGIAPGSLFIAGGLLLFLVSIDLLFARPKPAGSTDKQHDHDIAIFPLALPLLSGPGAITAILIFSSNRPGSTEFKFILFLIVGIILVIAALTMLGGEIVSKVLGRTGVAVIERIMGILLAGMSVQFVYDGLLRLGVLVL